MDGPLEGIRILDWTIFQQGTVATAMLGDLGAEVIKIEGPDGDPGRAIKNARGIVAEIGAGRNFYFEYNNHNKKAIALDLKKEAAREVIYRLVAKSDVMVQNFRKGVAEKLKMDWETLRQYNPKLIYASASGYGRKGPDANKPAMDYQGLARSGFMYQIGEPDMPPLSVEGAIADQMGAVILAYGVMAALLARERIGIGQEISTSHLGSMITLQGLPLAAHLLTGRQVTRRFRSEGVNPLWNHYECKDGVFIAMGHSRPDKYWKNLCQALNIEEMADDPRLVGIEGMREHHEEVKNALSKAFATKTYEEWDHILKKYGDFIYDKIQNIMDLPSDTQVLENKYIDSYDHPDLGPIKMVGIPVQFSETPGGFRLPAPEYGQHTEEILIDELGYTWDDIEKLRNAGAIL